MDGIDLAVIETDGERVASYGPTASLPYSDADRAVIRAAVDAAQRWEHGAPAPNEIAAAEKVVTDRHIELVQKYLGGGGSADLIGFHGQTVYHRPDLRWTVQLGDGAAMAKALGIQTVTEFRKADVAAGGEGAPFAPLYHKALVDSSDGLPGGPVVAVNLGGVGNVTYIDGDEVLAFDTGPANGPMDDWLQSHNAGVYDEKGKIAAKGTADEARIAEALKHDYFSRVPPKSLDRLDFTSALAEGLSLEDGCATLTAFSAATVAKAMDHFAKEPAAWVLCGGGRHNPTLVGEIKKRVPGMVLVAEDLGWRGDHIEAEAFALLAVRSINGQPLSLPTTTGVPKPMSGGVVYKP